MFGVKRNAGIAIAKNDAWMRARGGGGMLTSEMGVSRVQTLDIGFRKMEIGVSDHSVEVG